MKGLFDSTDEFRLIDIDEVYLSSPFYAIISEPVGYSDGLITLERPVEDRGGVNFEYGDEETTLGYDHHDSVYEIIQSIINIKGVDARIGFQHWTNATGTNSILYEGRIVAESMDEGDAQINLRVERQDYENALNARFKILQDLQSSEDLDGNAVTPFELREIALHSKTITEKLNAQTRTSTLR